MATFDSPQYAKWVADPFQGLRSNEWHGRVRMRYAEWTGDAAQNDFVNLFPVYKNERPILFAIDWTDMGTAITLDVGVTADEDKYVAALDVATAAGRTVVMPLSTAVEAADDVVQAKLEGGNPASGTIKIAMFYVRD